MVGWPWEQGVEMVRKVGDKLGHVNNVIHLYHMIATVVHNSESLDSIFLSVGVLTLRTRRGTER